MTDCGNCGKDSGAVGHLSTWPTKGYICEMPREAKAEIERLRVDRAGDSQTITGLRYERDRLRNAWAIIEVAYGRDDFRTGNLDEAFERAAAVLKGTASSSEDGG